MTNPILNFRTVRETVKKLLVGLLSNNCFENYIYIATRWTAKVVQYGAAYTNS